MVLAALADDTESTKAALSYSRGANREGEKGRTNNDLAAGE
jgi:hypothetical protein